MTAPDWTKRARCLGVNPELFYPNSAGSGKGDAARAKQWCDACPVRVECLEYALSIERGGLWARHGIWGGTSPDERRLLARRRKEGSA